MLKHQGVSNHNPEYAPMCFQLFRYERKLILDVEDHLLDLTHQGHVMYMCQQSRPSLVQIIAGCLFGAKLSYESMLAYDLLFPWNNFHWTLYQAYTISFNENEFQKVVFKIVDILSYLQCVPNLPSSHSTGIMGGW